MKVKLVFSTAEAVEKGIILAKRMIESDGYYGMYPSRNSPSGDLYGTGLVGRGSRGKWRGWLIADLPPREGLEVSLAEARLLLEAGVGWISSGGNRTRLQIKDGQLTVSISSRRHGVPYKEEIAAIDGGEVLEYSTQEATWKWHETKDDHPEKEGWEDLEEAFDRK